VISHAAEVNVRYEDKIYNLSAEFNVEATPARVMEVLTDFENISDLNPAIVESELQDSTKQKGLRVKTVVKDCILFFVKALYEWKISLKLEMKSLRHSYFLY